MKSILVHLDASPRSAVRLAYAQELARAHGSELTAVYAVMPALLTTPWVGGEAMAGAASLLADVDKLQRERALGIFQQAVAKGPLAWVDASDEMLMGALLRVALYSDLLVLGQSDPADPLTGSVPPDLVPALAADSGKPALVFPSAGSYPVIGRRPLLAWKPTREAARAAVAALPWLRQAERVHLACQAGPEESAQTHTAPLQHWLRLQGVKAGFELHSVGPGDAGEALLSLAADAGADLLVMGCFGHSRAREWVLGGASRTVLRSMTLPVLMAH
jgi:nucleotide-binding universal stress UspA family protein